MKSKQRKDCQMTKILESSFSRPKNDVLLYIDLVEFGYNVPQLIDSDKLQFSRQLYFKMCDSLYISLFNSNLYNSNVSLLKQVLCFLYVTP